MDAITAAIFLEVGKIMIANLGGPMSILLPASILSAVLVAYLLYHRCESTAFMLATLAVALMVAALPPDWRATRDRWEFYHGIRTVLSVAALSCLVGSVLVSRGPSGTAHVVKRAA
jgi:glucose dehydrogenase